MIADSKKYDCSVEFFGMFQSHSEFFGLNFLELPFSKKFQIKNTNYIDSPKGSPQAPSSENTI